MRNLLRCQKGLTEVEILLVTPFVICYLLFLITIGRGFGVKIELPHASREAARQAAVLGEVGPYSKPWQTAVDTISKSLPTSLSIGTSSNGVKQAFSPSSPNPDQPDVVVEKVPGYYTAAVSYHIITPAPGMAKLLNPDAEWLEKYITITSKIYFPDEDEGSSP